VVTVEGDNLCATTTYKGLVLEIEHNQYDKELKNFEMTVVFEKDQDPFDFECRR